MENSKASNTPAYPRAVNHVGVGVADIERAIRWYQEVLGFTLLMGPIEVRAADPGSNVHDVLGQDCNALLQAHMVSINGIGIELFQLLDPPHERRDPPLEYWKSGFFHICVTDPDIEGLAGRIASSGGRQRSPSHLFWMGADPLAAVDALGDAIHHVHAKETALNEVALSLAGRLETVGHEKVKDRAWNYITFCYGHGDQWWRAFCYRLRLNGYDGWLSIEHEDIVLSRIEGLRKSVTLLKHASIDEASDYTLPAT